MLDMAGCDPKRLVDSARVGPQHIPENVQLVDLRRLRRACLAAITPTEMDHAESVKRRLHARRSGAPIPPSHMSVEVAHLIEHTAAWVGMKPEFEQVLQRKKSSDTRFDFLRDALSDDGRYYRECLQYERLEQDGKRAVDSGAANATAQEAAGQPQSDFEEFIGTRAAETQHEVAEARHAALQDKGPSVAIGEGNEALAKAQQEAFAIAERAEARVTAANQAAKLAAEAAVAMEAKYNDLLAESKQPARAPAETATVKTESPPAPQPEPDAKSEGFPRRPLVWKEEEAKLAEQEAARVAAAEEAACKAAEDRATSQDAEAATKQAAEEEERQRRAEAEAVRAKAEEEQAQTIESARVAAEQEAVQLTEEEKEAARKEAEERKRSETQAAEEAAAKRKADEEAAAAAKAKDEERERDRREARTAEQEEVAVVVELTRRDSDAEEEAARLKVDAEEAEDKVGGETELPTNSTEHGQMPEPKLEPEPDQSAQVSTRLAKVRGTGNDAIADLMKKAEASRVSGRTKSVRLAPPRVFCLPLH